MAGRIALVTGFEPYGGRGINPAAEVVKRIDGTAVADATVVGRLLPVSFDRLRGHLDDLLDTVKPAVVLSLGLWPGEPVLRLERLAVNVADFEIADNEGRFVTDEPLAGNGATALSATLPLRAIEQALLAAGIPIRISNSAGTFLCNATMFAVLHALAARGRAVPAGFLHLPYLPVQVAHLLEDTRRERVLELGQRADLASMELGTMVRAVEIALGVALA